MTENQYQEKLIKRLKKMFPGCEILKNDSGLRQGILDLTILYHEFWGMLEVKISPDAPYQPNQEYYLEKFEEMHFARVIYPEIEEEVLSALQQAFEPRRRARVS